MYSITNLNFLIKILECVLSLKCQINFNLFFIKKNYSLSLLKEYFYSLLHGRILHLFKKKSFLFTI